MIPSDPQMSESPGYAGGWGGGRLHTKNTEYSPVCLHTCGADSQCSCFLWLSAYVIAVIHKLLIILIICRIM